MHLIFSLPDRMPFASSGRLALLFLPVMLHTSIAMAHPHPQDQPSKPPTAASWLNKAREAAKVGDLSEAAEHTEKALAIEPDHRLGLYLAAQLYTAIGVDLARRDRAAASKPLLRGSQAMRKLAGLKKVLSENEQRMLTIVIYNEACCHALRGEKQLAMQKLRETLAAGFRELKTLETDSDLKSLREDEEFQKLVANLKKQLEKDKDGSGSAK